MLSPNPTTRTGRRVQFVPNASLETNGPAGPAPMGSLWEKCHQAQPAATQRPKHARRNMTFARLAADEGESHPGLTIFDVIVRGMAQNAPFHESPPVPFSDPLPRYSFESRSMTFLHDHDDDAAYPASGSISAPAAFRTLKFCPLVVELAARRRHPCLVIPSMQHNYERTSQWQPTFH